ncbi:MAG: molybdopterin molybdenumtransferase MoeA [Proteobacteria bacterium]|nr:MAG: molybdopterin molybdenumtransferase MoeA [Pseudomonadota bacterium]
MSETELDTAANCGDDREPALLPVDEALSRIRAAITVVPDRERVAVRSALGRVLATDISAPGDVPMHTNSAMDGYAFAAGSLPDADTADLTVVGTSWAGRSFDGEVGPGECVRIMTGAVMPAGADTVEMQERTDRDGDTVRISLPQKPGNHVRYAGEDMKSGTAALPAGRRVTPADLGLIASLGFGEVDVWRRPRVAFFSNGDELRSVGEPLRLGDIYDSNRYTLYGMLTRLGVEFLDMGVVRDDPDAIREAFTSGARCADMLITSAGASVGEADYIKDTLDELGEVDFWKMALKPGRPLAFGRVGDTPFFGLPGNPVSVMVTFYQFVRPALIRMSGETETPRYRFRARVRGGIRKRPGRTEYQRGRLTQSTDGSLEVGTTGDQGSGILRSMSVSDCFIVLTAEQGDVADGDWVVVEPFAGLV